MFKLKVKKNYVLFVIALVAGGTMTHSLVPPTPGPLFVAEELGVNLGTMILTGIIIGICCSTVGLLYARWLNQRMEVPLRETPEAMKNKFAHSFPRILLGLSVMMFLTGMPGGLQAGR